jgi:hypothetical protein
MLHSERLGQSRCIAEFRGKGTVTYITFFETISCHHCLGRKAAMKSKSQILIAKP